MAAITRGTCIATVPRAWWAALSQSLNPISRPYKNTLPGVVDQSSARQRRNGAACSRASFVLHLRRGFSLLRETMHAADNCVGSLSLPGPSMSQLFNMRRGASANPTTSISNTTRPSGHLVISELSQESASCPTQGDYDHDAYRKPG